ncbi:MAG: hypothetical protein ACREA5_00650 [Nitrosotalea sp.]
MSKKILVFAVLFSLAISIMVTQEASALTKGPGNYSRSTANVLGPNRVCGNHTCNPQENSKWSTAVLSSQRQGPGKATGAQYGIVVMHQVVVNYLAKPTPVNQAPWSNSSMPMQPSMNATGSK